MEAVNKYYTPAAKEEKRCLYCNSAFLGIQRKNFCNKQCRHKYYNIKVKALERVFTCVACSTPFATTHKRKYCSEQCQDKYRNRLRYIGPHTKQCQVCNKPFLAKGKDKKNCSIECWKEAEKARHIRVRYHIKRTQIEKVDRNRVFEAYNWHCAMCHTPTPTELKGSFLPNEPTLDHIIPLSKGGSHTYNNLQLLCRRCNCAVKNDKTDPVGSQITTAFLSRNRRTPNFFSGAIFQN
jgi:5-methylcytosine-specific restriction endonuclease McrA